MNAHEQRLVDDLRARIAQLEAPSAKPKKRKTNVAALWYPAVVARITKAVADEFDVAVETLMDQSKQSQVVLRRQIAMYLCRRAGMTLSAIAEAFHMRSHGTVMCAERRVAKLLISSLLMGDVLERISRRLEAAPGP